jgi:hypothetical protein
MIKTLKTIFKVNAAMCCNKFLFWLHRIPLLGRLFPERLYADSGTKQTILAIHSTGKTIYSFFGKFFYLAILSLLMFLPYNNALLSYGWSMFVWILFFCSFVVGAFLQPETVQASPLKYTCIRYLKMDARRFTLASLLKRQVILAVTFTPALMVAALVYGHPAVTGLLLSLELACIRLTGEAVHLAVFRRTRKLILRNAGYIILLVLVGFTAAFLPLFIKAAPPIDLFLLHPVAPLCFLALGLISLFYLLRYPDYFRLARELNKPEFADASLAKEKARKRAFKDVVLKDSDLSAEDSKNTLTHLHGYSFLNALFFLRHRRMLQKPVLIELVIVAVLGVAGLICALVFRPETADIINTQLTRIIPFSVFLIYMAANGIGTRICKAMFYNCDISLLRYGWYRQKSVVLKNFSLRLGRLTIMNLSVAGALCLVIVLITALSGATPPVGVFVPFLLSILCLALMFSVHPLFMYYIFQPYTTSLDVKNPFFSIINFVVYLISYMCTQLHQAPTGFALVVMAATIVYTVAALIIVYFKASKTFRVK